MKSTKRKEVVRKEDGSIIKNDQSWTEKGLAKYRDYQTKYIAESYRTFMFRVRRDTDAKLIKFCESQENFAGTMVSLIRGEMMRKGILPNDTFACDKDFTLKVVVTFFMANDRISVADYIAPELTKIPQKDPKYKYEIVTSDINSITVAINYSPEYSMQGVIAETGLNLELYIQKKCAKILTQFGINPVSNLFKREYQIEGDKTVEVIATKE